MFESVGFQTLLLSTASLHLLLLVSSAHSQLTFFSTHPEPADGYAISAIDITHDGQVFAVGCADANAYVYGRDGIGFTHLLNLTEGSSRMHELAMSGDGQWMAASFEDGTVKVYSAVSAGRFQLAQTLSITGDTSPAFSVSMTDDNQWLAVGKLSGQAYVFKHNGAGFELNETVSVGNDITSVALSDDHQMLAVGTEGDTYIYKFGSIFTLNQTISLTPYVEKKISLTPDQQHLTISLNTVVSIYQNTQTQFELLESIQLSRDSTFSSISPNKELLLISTSHETYVYANATTGNTSLVQTLAGSLMHAFSEQSEYVVLGKENEVHVYLYCDYDQSGGFYNATEGFCHCQPEKDRFF